MRSNEWNEPRRRSNDNDNDPLDLVRALLGLASAGGEPVLRALGWFSGEPSMRAG